MNYKLLWQLEREENEQLKVELRIAKAAINYLKEENKDLKDANGTLLKSVEQQRIRSYENFR
jgi:hypothetical protein